jgi:hypothetical protein
MRILRWAQATFYLSSQKAWWFLGGFLPCSNFPSTLRMIFTMLDQNNVLAYLSAPAFLSVRAKESDVGSPNGV